jgi:predicted lipoprotein with Yx(FWY)xxD motif
MVVAGITGLAVAALAGLAVAKSVLVNVTKNVSVAGKTESVASDVKGKTLYTLGGESARPKHLFCTGVCSTSIWPMLTVKSAKSLTKAAGLKGKLGTLKRGSVLQVTLNGHPLYTFSGDGKRMANGEGLAIGSHVWHAVKASSTKTTKTTTSTGTTTTTTSTSTSSTCSLYPPYC